MADDTDIMIMLISMYRYVCVYDGQKNEQLMRVTGSLRFTDDSG